MESDIRYYRRRAFEEMAAASRAVTEAARGDGGVVVVTVIRSPTAPIGAAWVVRDDGSRGPISRRMSRASLRVGGRLLIL